jgi:hypothetical protein
MTHPALLHYQHPITIQHRGYTVGNGEHSAVSELLPDDVVYCRFRVRIYGSRRLIQDEDLGTRKTLRFYVN